MATPNIIWRIDDRLIHGQVIVGWCGQLPINLLVVCDDEIASKEWEMNLLLMAAPSELSTEVLSTNKTAERVPIWRQQDLIVMVLIKSPEELMKLLNLGVDIQKVNVGGIHFQENRKEYLSYLYLTPKEVELFKQMINTGIKFDCQDLPNSPSHDLEKILERKK